MSSLYKKRSWQSLLNRLPRRQNCFKSYSLSRTDRINGTYHTGTYYGFATIFGQLRLRFTRQCLFFDLNQSKVTWQSESTEQSSSILVTWSQLARLRRRNAEALEFIFHAGMVPSSMARLMAEDHSRGPSTTTKLTINFAMGAAEELLEEMRLLGCVRKVRYGFWKLRKCYIPVMQNAL